MSPVEGPRAGGVVLMKNIMRLGTCMLFGIWIMKCGKSCTVSIIYNYPDKMRISRDQEGAHRTLGRVTGILLADSDLNSHFSSSQTLLFREATSDHLFYHPPSASISPTVIWATCHYVTSSLPFLTTLHLPSWESGVFNLLYSSLIHRRKWVIGL